MRFHASFQPDVLTALSRLFLPALERFGKTAKILLTPTHWHVILDTDDTTGPWAVLSLAANAVFSTYTLEARHKSSIGLSVDLAMLTRTLKMIGANPMGAPNSITVRLAKRPRPGAENATMDGMPSMNPPTQQLHPCLVLTADADFGGTMTQELPVSQPMGAELVDSLLRVAGAEGSAPVALPRGVPSGPPHLQCPFYVRLAPYAAAARLHGTCDRMKNLNNAATVAVCDDGSVHVQVRGHSCHVGVALDGFGVVNVETRPPDAGVAPSTSAASTATGAAGALGVLCSPAAPAQALVNAVNARSAALVAASGGATSSSSGAATCGPHALVARIKLKDLMHSLSFATQTQAAELWLGVDGVCVDDPHAGIVAPDGVTYASYLHAVFKYYSDQEEMGVDGAALDDPTMWDNSVGVYTKLPRYADGGDECG